MPLWAPMVYRELRVTLGKRLIGCALCPLPLQKGAAFAIVVLHFVWWLQLVSKPCYTNIGSGARVRALAAGDFWIEPYILDFDVELPDPTSLTLTWGCCACTLDTLDVSNLAYLRDYLNILV